ncbi:Serine/threonine-protein kinase BRI1-like 1 [Nymphaea thermarum]|nr:Serine/threonine-protein kinase BRI1-like 1 [Nymphaea thermarum]
MGCLLLLLLLLVSTVDGVASASCLNSQASILLRFKEDLHLSNGRLSSWGGNGNESDSCLWEGVECDSHTGYIIGLELLGKATIDKWTDIAGPRIPPALFDLHLLQHLDLSGCDFNMSTIPSQLGQLTHLTHLNLSRAQFSGKVPDEISSLSNLVALDLSGLFNFLEIQDLEVFVENFKQLKYLHLDYVRFNLSNSQEWGASLASALPNLRSLSLAGCGLEGSLTPHIFMLPHLQALDLSYNNLQGELMPSFFPPESKLQSLRLSVNNLSGHLPNEIFELPLLKVLDVGDNELLRVPLPTKLPSSNLEILSLGGIELLGNHLPVWIVNMTSLVQLELSNTNLSGSLPFSIANLADLTHLDLSQTRLSGCIDSLLFANLTRLTYLDLSRNSFSGLLPSLPHSIRVVQLNNNNFSGPIPNSYNLLNMEWFDLSYNSFVGPFPSSLFQEPSFAQSPLEYLDLSNNKFDGYLDLGIFTNFKKLWSLSLSRNSLTVGIDNHTLSFPSIKYLILASCNINQFPRFLRYHKSIGSLDLSENMIIGEIPKWLNVSFSLNISGNMITGIEPGVVLNAYLVDLSYNMLNSLPSSLSFNGLEYLSIKDNSVTGQIPASLCNHTELWLVDLSYNKFSGQIPACLFNMTLEVVKLPNNRLRGQIPELSDDTRAWLRNAFQELLMLDISTNQFTGKLPTSLLLSLNAMKTFNSSNALVNVIGTRGFGAAWEVTMITKGIKLSYKDKTPFLMNTIDLSYNYFEGEIPKEIGDLNRLQALRISNNKLRGSIPKNFGGLRQLESLDLSHNYLSGEIPKELTELNFLEYLNLSYNNLSGRIPESPQFFTFDAGSFEGNPSLCGRPLSLPCEEN